ncbi:hypothetical protein BP6252_13143 [Coleophoma cylindrospora]|uniref:Uncharacterized protein n=1 Tax=Coleophoma cylindrospora TaxID=1849047 RepID=A0A3D8QAH3_9HELO|nr:hypothetical protein BP6252_13143 [Coleophoma cylindrospora]
MSNGKSEPIFCDNIGNATDALHCCYLSNQASSACQDIFAPSTDSLEYPVGDWVVNCQNTSLLYSSWLQDNLIGNNLALFRRYNTCANVPALAGYLSQGVLSPNISSAVVSSIPQNTTAKDLMGVTSAVTDCLTETCRSSRASSRCYDSCSPVRLLTNNTMPSISAVNDCLYTLCTGGDRSLPYADPDVIGIGVFSSYIMQCVFVFLLFVGFLIFTVVLRRRGTASTGPGEAKTPSTTSHASNDQRFTKRMENFTTLLVEFQKAQCYFSGTLQVASLSYGILGTSDMLVTFMLMPLATNGVLPITFIYLILFHWNKAEISIALLTTTCWILSSIVYWILYASLIPIDSEAQKSRAYQQFFYKLSAIPACGEYSALAICQNNFWEGKEPIHIASYKLRALTPIIWTFSTVCLFIVLGYQIHSFFSECRHQDSGRPSTRSIEKGQKNSHWMQISSHVPMFSALFWLATICFLAGIGMQLSLLSIGITLNMLDPTYWTFGQIVAVTIWLPPLLEYLFDELLTLKAQRA